MAAPYEILYREKYDTGQLLFGEMQVLRCASCWLLTDSFVTRTVAKIFTCDLMTCVLNLCKNSECVIRLEVTLMNCTFKSKN